VREFPYKTWLLAVVFGLMPCIASAAGLGKLTVLSALGQPLLAEIDLVTVQKEELSTLTARLAAPEAFQQARIPYSTALVGVRMSIEKRSNGAPYVKITSSRPINEPFVSMLVELSWAQGRLVREYTTLIDPPGYSPAPIAAAPAPPTVPAAPAAAPAPSAAPEAKPAESALPPLISEPPGAKPAGKAPAAAAAKGESKQYGPVKRGDTLSKIAAGVKPEGVTLEQMLVSLYRANPDAFVGNMNRLKTGKILRVPEKEDVAATTAPEAVKEVRVQAANWNAYRKKLAEAAGETPAQEGKSAASGKITTAVEDKSAGKEAPKEVLKLSKGEPAKAGKAAPTKPISMKERVRMLEEEATAREKALAEANDRVAQLEKTIKDMQSLIALKGQAPGAKPVPAAKPEAVPPPAKAETAKEVAKAEPAKAEAAKAEPAKTEPAKAEPAKEVAKAEPAKEAAKAAEAPKAGEPVAGQPKPKPKPKVVAPPPPPPEPSLVDQLTGNPIYMAGAGGLIAALGLGGYFVVRRRRAAGTVQDEKTAPKIGKVAAAAAMAAAPVITPPAAPSDDVDPLAEADLYLNFGRDVQAEEVLKEALEKNPRHEEVQLKLLQIYAGRKDRSAFEAIAKNLHAQTSGAGDNWVKAAAMGYALDAANPLYEAGKSAPAAAVPAAGAPAGSADHLDFDLELSQAASPTATDVVLDAGDKTSIMKPGELGTAATQDITADSAAVRAAATEVPVAPDFTLHAGAPAAQAPALPDITLDDAGKTAVMTDVTAAEPAVSNMIDFSLETPAKADATVVLSAPPPVAPAAKPDAATTTGSIKPLQPDFKLDLGGETAPAAAAGGAAPTAPAIPDIKLDDISLSLEGAPGAGAAPAGGGVKDDHWNDVQTKFDLAKAYQEMGDKDGAREILQEVIKEGDAGQQAEAKKLLESLG